MELKEGMYVRTEKGKITKIDRKVDDITNYYFGCFECDNYINVNGDEFISEYEILKASHNIIDLIEVGDYVNGCKVVNINYDLNYDEDIVESITIFDYSIEEKDILHNDDIKSIVTKEQFESISYEVGE